MNELFHKIAVRTSRVLGSPPVFFAAVTLVISWALTGPLFGFSTTWQLFINTFTTIATFLMVFLIQNTQNRDAKAVHLKLDEIIRSHTGARNALIDLEALTDNDLDLLQADFEKIREHARSPHAKHLHSKIEEERERRNTNRV